MPLGKYHCDYCDKEFQDTPVARKRHLQSSSHLRAKSIWYNSFNSNSSDANRGFRKGICNRFVKTGFCPFGDSCQYLHPSNTNSNLVTNLNAPQGDVVRDSMGMSWANLPPSLKLPPEGGYPQLPFVDWG
ncbi:zinc finger CCCH domain-containing protein 3 isoform X2 [Mercurialis annua]|uniref:zinc finger CCCH domain-containing protein 3 isoform X2 n=1 Tax=Mercurialis annua TaxID=3986 RepID=UPI00215EF137|nr:zinc finger CCCH domain-containing protein 3 isoform X2 [Mercurialis annua]